MRIKAIPAEIVQFAEHNPWVIIGGVSALALGIYYINVHGRIVEDVAPGTASQATYGYASPVLYPTAGSDSGYSGIVDSVTNAASPTTAASNTATGTTGDTLADGTVSALDLFNFQKLKNDQAFQLSEDTLNANLAIAAYNQLLGLASIQSANYTASASLASAFLNSNKNISIGSIKGPDGANFSFSFGQAFDKGSANFLRDETNNGGLAAMANALGVNSTPSNTNYGQYAAAPQLTQTTYPSYSPSKATNDNYKYANTGSVASVSSGSGSSSGSGGSYKSSSNLVKNL